MPLNEQLPVIDDRRYSDILEELRTRIPRYTPEWKGWTDLNDNDPGITLSQLMAWLTEMMIFRMGKVPELNYLKFLELLGVDLRSAQPAIAEVEFSVQETYMKPYVLVASGTQVSAEDEDGGAPIVFETDAAIYAMTAQLVSVQAFDGFAYRDVKPDNDSLSPYFPFGNAPRAGAALYLGFKYPPNYPGPLVFPKIDLDLAVTVSAARSQSQSPLACGPVRGREYPSTRIVWEGWNGNDWQPLGFIKDDTLTLTRSGHILLQTPQPKILQPAKVGEKGAEQEGHFIRARLDSSQYERAPELLTIRSNTARATQAETVTDEVLGGSDGTRNQTFTVTNRPVLPESLKLEVNEGDGFKPWQRVDDFFSSNVDDTHYALNATSGEVRLGGVRFGDSLHGHVPVANVSLPETNVVARRYRFGGGKRGNVKAGTITTLITPVDGIDGKVINRFDAHSGREEESIDEAKIRASRSVRSRSRAVTADDFEQLAQESANVKRAKALPLYHPNFPETPIPGVVSVIVVPDSDADQPIPSEGTLRTVCSYLDDRRLLTTELFVLKPTYQRIELQGDVIVEDNADLGEVKTNLETELKAYLHPLKGGEDGKGWPFGGMIFYSKIMNRIFRVPGVATIQQLDIYLDGEKKEKCQDVDIKPHTLIYSTEHHVDVHYSSEEESA